MSRLLFLFIIVVLAGCQSVKIPELPDFDLGLGKEQVKVQIKQENSKVNIRPTPGTDQAPIAVLKGGDTLLLLAEENNWLEVRFFDTDGSEKKGWIYKYLVEGYNKAQASKPKPSTKVKESPAAASEPAATPSSEDEQVSPL